MPRVQLPPRDVTLLDKTTFPYHHIPCDVVYRERVTKDLEMYSTITTFTVFMKTETLFKVPTTIIQQYSTDNVSDVETVVASDDEEEPILINMMAPPEPEPINRHVQINSLPEVRVFTDNTQSVPTSLVRSTGQALKSALRRPRSISRSPPPNVSNTVASPANEQLSMSTDSQRTEENTCSLELPSYDESEARSMEQPQQDEEPWLPMPDLTRYKDPAQAEKVRRTYEAINAFTSGKERSPPPPVTPLANRWMFFKKNRDYVNHKKMHIVGGGRPAWSGRSHPYQHHPCSQSEVVTTDHMDVDGTVIPMNTSDMDIDGAVAATTTTEVSVGKSQVEVEEAEEEEEEVAEEEEEVEEEEVEEEEDWEEIYGKASEWANSQPLQDEVEDNDDVPTQPVSEEDDEQSTTVPPDATQYTTCTPFQSCESGFGNDPRYNPSIRMLSKTVHIFESATHQPLEPPMIYADVQECADAYQTTVQTVLRSCLEKVNIANGHYAQFFDIDHTHEIWKEHPDFPGYFFSSRGAVLGKSKKILAQRAKEGYRTVTLRHEGQSKGVYVHRALYRCFFPHINIDNLTINHDNMKKHDNRIGNLTPMTQRENNEHARSMLARIRRHRKASLHQRPDLIDPSLPGSQTVSFFASGFSYDSGQQRQS
ncbi:hypothetical protein HDU85_006558 [Gaertneriomyces sp. JEL0708]|nr:hypothetical protein HDU85_006558 [Gaertneriomyces sp. JEL0708]